MKSVKIILLLCITILFFSTTASANPVYIGVPETFSSSNLTGVFFWKDSADTYHLSVKTAGDTHILTGTIETDGSFEECKEVPITKDPNKDNLYTSKNKGKINLKLTSTGPETGITFKISDARKINFTLYWDNSILSPANIYIGKESWHPEHGNFSMDIPAAFNIHMGNPDGDDSSSEGMVFSPFIIPSAHGLQ